LLIKPSGQLILALSMVAEQSQCTGRAASKKKGQLLAGLF
jgi:hypothetical protein